MEYLFITMVIKCVENTIAQYQYLLAFLKKLKLLRVVTNKYRLRSFIFMSFLIICYWFLKNVNESGLLSEQADFLIFLSGQGFLFSAKLRRTFIPNLRLSILPTVFLQPQIIYKALMV